MRGKFYYCYDVNIKKFLMNKGYKYLLIAMHPETYKKFWLFERNDELTKCIDEYYK